MICINASHKQRSGIPRNSSKVVGNETKQRWKGDKSIFRVDGLVCRSNLRFMSLLAPFYTVSLSRLSRNVPIHLVRNAHPVIQDILITRLY
jgi:hypothetical protein